MAGWRYFATKLNGDGTESMLHPDIPLGEDNIDEELSGFGGIFGSIEPEIMGLKTESGEPVFVPWSTAIYAEEDGNIRGSSIFTRFSVQDSKLQLESVGWGAYPSGMPWVGEERQFVHTEALDIIRAIWSHLQEQPKGNLGVTVDQGVTGVKFGEPEEDVEFETGSGESVSFAAGPVRFAEWQTHDLGKEIDDLATAAPFDWKFDHYWSEDRTKIVHYLRFAYPRMGIRRHELRFAVGENIIEVPEETVEGDEWFSSYMVLGSGEGSKMVRGFDDIVHDRLRRVGIHSDKSINSKTAAVKKASQLLKLNSMSGDLQEIMVIDHPHARIGSYEVGDEIAITTLPGWMPSEVVWYRILGITIEPESGTSRLSIVRSEKV